MEEIRRFRNKNSDRTLTVKRSDEFKRYRKKVRELTETVKHLIPGIENRGFTTHHIDHKVSIWEGFAKGLSVEVIGNLDNLRIIPAIENLKKGRKFNIL